jgi:hypothetical protein
MKKESAIVWSAGFIAALWIGLLAASRQLAAAFERTRAAFMRFVDIPAASRRVRPQFASQSGDKSPHSKRFGDFRELR